MCYFRLYFSIAAYIVEVAQLVLLKWAVWAVIHKHSIIAFISEHLNYPLSWYNPPFGDNSTLLQQFIPTINKSSFFVLSNIHSPGINRGSVEWNIGTKARPEPFVGICPKNRLELGILLVHSRVIKAQVTSGISLHTHTFVSTNILSAQQLHTQHKYRTIMSLFTWSDMLKFATYLPLYLTILKFCSVQLNCLCIHNYL